ncbi:MAG: DUF5681 domain-containing protein [Pseudomonadota bacterium]
MTKRNTSIEPQPSTAPSTYDVGYGKPPTANQFKPGQSGNPKGRPKGSKNKPKPVPGERLYDIIRAEADRPVSVPDPDKGSVDITMAEAITRSTFVKAAKGNVYAQRSATRMISEADRHVREQRESLHSALMELKINGQNAIDRAQRAGQEPPELYPHPDHIVLNMSTGEIHITGPMTKEEKLGVDAMLRRITNQKQRLVEEVDAYIALDPDDPEHDDWKETIIGAIYEIEESISDTESRLPPWGAREYRQEYNFGIEIHNDRVLAFVKQGHPLPPGVRMVSNVIELEEQYEIEERYLAEYRQQTEGDRSTDRADM